MLFPPDHFSALLDNTSGALLTLSRERPIISWLVNNQPDCWPSWGVNRPNYVARFALADADPLTFPEWTWVGHKRQFERTPEVLLTDRVRHASALAVRKSYALYELINAISTARNLLWSGVLLQETVHLTKKAQALQYKADGFPEEDRLRYPYVLQYAAAIGVPMKEAALEIIFRAQLDDEVLARTEAIRMKYFGRLKTAELRDIDALMVEFRSEIR